MCVSIPSYYRPTEVDYLLADAKCAQDMLDWTPRVKFIDLVRIMVDADMQLVGLGSPGEGQRIVNEQGNGWHR